MPEYCTCGTALVENARFCHRCGRPTREEEVNAEAARLAAEEAARSEPPAQTLQQKIAQLPVSFRNPIALRVAFIMSLGIMLMQLIPVLNLLFVIWWMAAGWGAVLLYRKLTGASLSVPAGARLGSITGILTFVSMTVVFAASVFFAGGQLRDQLMKQNPQISEVLNNPAMLAAVALLTLAAIFVMVVGLCAAGGALGARFTTPRADPR